jgi:hypothetical protein
MEALLFELHRLFLLSYIQMKLILASSDSGPSLLEAGPS